MVGAPLKSSQSWEVWVHRDNCLSKGVGLAEGSLGWLPDIAINIGHENDRVPGSFPENEGS